ncbi:MAG: hypothetical protein V7K97_05675 [Nostoc sp.]|uniref:hypothetical protein n=1 Tax=Nostoc sp. TaxID=1180 RepID=UPI002FF6D7AA
MKRVSLVQHEGTLEQLLITPVASTSILISKIVPISALLTGTLLICLIKNPGAGCGFWGGQWRSHLWASESGIGFFASNL